MPRKLIPQTPLYVRIPTAAGDKLDRAAAALGIHKKDLVADLVKKYVPDTNDGGLMMGTYSFHPYDPPEIMSAAQAGQFLQIEEPNVIELAEAGRIPGKKLGPVWRFSRDALVQWLATPDPKEKR
jgi:excisionase family DNA binding protein